MRTLSLLAVAIIINLNIYSQEIIVSKDSLSLLFDNVSFTSQDSLMIYNVGTAILNVDTIFSTEASGFILNIILEDTTIHSTVTWRNNFYTPFSIEPNDSAKLVFIFPLWIPETIYLRETWTDSIVILNNSQNNNVLVLPALIDFPLSVDNSINNYPKKLVLEQNYPNPFNPTTKIRFTIPEVGITTLKVYDILGSEIVTLINEEKNAGKYKVEFDATNFPSGVYFYQLRVYTAGGGAGKFIQTKKMVLIK
jgi:hypothetical protein